ncbi:GXWXG domain-containing protein [Paracoccus actinidiae]|uniref:GXWXG domain-containing protein n=1 Tax=Paracoccus actinidiae TaxID=3064531 RepID=UPI00359C85F8
MGQWRSNGLSAESALTRFDSLPGTEPEELTGTWRGSGLPTGHPLDGLLERLGWQGKRFECKERVYPLIFHPDIALDPSRLPLSVALRWPRVARSIPVRGGFALVRRALLARGPSASLAPLCQRSCPPVVFSSIFQVGAVRSAPSWITTWRWFSTTSPRCGSMARARSLMICAPLA